MPRLMSAAMRWKDLPTPMPRSCGCPDLLAHLPVAVLKARFTARQSRHESAAAPKEASALLGQQQLAAVLDRGLGHFGKALQQPRQHDFHLHMIFRDVDMAGRRLARARERERSCGCLPIAPHRRSAPARWKRRATARSSDGAWPLRGRGCAEWKRPAVWSSQKSSRLILNACNCTPFERKRRADYRAAIAELWQIPVCCFRLRAEQTQRPYPG